MRRVIAAAFPAGGCSRGRRWASAFLGSMAIMTSAQDNVPASLFPLWDRSLGGRSGFGYKDNVLLSHSHPERSTFFSTGLEASVFRLAEDGTLLNFFFTADNNHYFSVSKVDDEWLVLGQVQLKKPFATDWEATFALDYFFQNQVLDVSATETNLSAIEVEGHNIQFTPALRRNFGEAGWLEISVPVARRIFREPLDSFWEAGPKLAFGHPYGRKSEWIVSYSFIDRPYDSRTETTSTGAAIPGTDLEFQQHKFEAASWHYWDEARRWRTVTKLSYRLNEDSGSGYFDYGKFQLSEQIRFRAKPWELLAEVRFGHYFYDTQTVSATDLSRRELSELIWHLRAEYQFHKWMKAYADFEHERNFSNQRLGRYAVNTVSAGVILEF